MAKQRKKVGFDTAGHSQPQAVVPPAPDDALLVFDNGSYVSFADATHNIIALGTAGSGKTMSIILPLYERLMRAGFGGALVDIKGNLGDYLRLIAQAYGRLDDIVEIGPGPGAEKINILKGKTPHEIEEIFRALLLTTQGRDDPNRHFHELGLRDTVACWQLFSLMCERTKSPLLFSLFARMLNDQQFARDLYRRYMADYHDATNPVERDLVQRITSDKMHHIDTTDGQSRSMADERLRQNSYRMGVIRNGLAMLMNSPGLVENFLAADGAGFDIVRRLYDENRIILLRFATQTGEIASNITQLFRDELYPAIINHGKSLPHGKFTFTIVDEMQDFYNSDKSSSWNDNSMVAKGREFNNIMIMATQSVAAMLARASDSMDAETLINNCNIRIIFYNDDPRTRNLMDKAPREPDDLGPGEAVLYSYSATTREHDIELVTAGEMYAATQKLLAQNTDGIDLPPALAPQERDTEREKADMAVLERVASTLLGPPPGTLGGTVTPAATITAAYEAFLASPEIAGLLASGELVRAQANYRFLAESYPKVFCSRSSAYFLPTGWVVALYQAVQLYHGMGFACEVEGVSIREVKPDQGGEYALQVVSKVAHEKSVRVTVTVRGKDGEEIVQEPPKPREPGPQELYTMQVHMLTRMMGEAVMGRCIVCGAKVGQAKSLYCPQHINTTG